MSFRNKGTTGPTVIVSLSPDRSGNYVCDAAVEAHDVTIQRAANYIGTLGGGVIKLKRGTYTITATITIGLETEIIGDGIDVTILDVDDGVTPLSVNPGGGVGEGGAIKNLTIELIENATGIIIDNARRFKVHDVRIYNEEATPGYTTGISIVNTSPFASIRECRLIGYLTSGVNIAGGNGSVIDECYLEGYDGATDVVVSDVEGTHIVNSWFEFTSPRGGTHIELDNANRTTISDNHIGAMYTAGSYGLHIHTNTRECIIDGNDFNATAGNQIYIPASAEEFNIISNNDFHTNGVSAIYCLQRDTIIEGNAFWVGADITNRVVRIEGADRCLITDNTFWAASLVAQRAINISGTADKCVVTENIIKDIQWGIYLAGVNVTETLVKDNTFDGVTTPCVDQGTDTRFAWWFSEVTDPDGNVGDHPVLVLPDTVDTTFRFQVPIPLEFNQLMTAHVIVTQTTTAGPPNMQWSTTTDWGKLCAGENYNAGSDAQTDQTTAVTQNQLNCIDVSNSLNGVAAGDLVGFTFIRRASQGGDTINADAYYLGFRLRYV